MKQPDKPFDMPALAADFAARHVACRADLQTEQEFPSDLWRKMGKAGLFRGGLPEEYGGDGCGYLDLLRTGEAFVRSGLNLGLGMSWIFQQIIARSVVGTFGTTEQCRQYLRAAALGNCAISFAVSEPGRGASPKALATKAQQQGESYLLTGEKTHLTNGPIADLFVVVAVTDDTSARKGFTAFMVPRGAQGLFVEPPMPLNFLKPSPHGGIQLNGCLIPKASVLGREGNAWEDIVVPLGETEDVVMMGPVLGGMAAQLDLLRIALRERSASAEKTLPGEWGALNSLWQALRSIACEAAGRLDRGNESPAPLSIAFARFAALFHADVARFTERLRIEEPERFSLLQKDMEFMEMLQKRRLQIRQAKMGAAQLAS
ncbi:MAG TPA: acyl-CoA dehydrogenase family protein [Smithellaceae bacterium]|nr:acyl-CoA dehydrogenase family protein [Smithellaceae bacterium]